ncbi:unnamed protein product, partial [Scytosiphon promiscuus]
KLTGTREKRPRKRANVHALMLACKGKGRTSGQGTDRTEGLDVPRVWAILLMASEGVAAAAAAVAHAEQSVRGLQGALLPAQQMADFGAVLQQLLAGQQEQAREIQLVKEQVQLQQPQVQQVQQQVQLLLQIQQQQQQQQQPAHPTAARAAGNLLSFQPAGGLLMTPPSANATSATKSVGAQLTEKRQADLWNAEETPKFYLLRGGFDIGRAMTPSRLRMVTKEVAFVTDIAAIQICELKDSSVENFLPPMPPGAIPPSIPAQVHLATMVEVLIRAISFGMEAAPEICTDRVNSLRLEMETVTGQLTQYLQLHYVELEPHPTKTRDTILEAINVDMNNWYHEVAVRADATQGSNPNGPPPAGSSDIMPAPKFMEVKMLILPDDVHGLVARSDTGAATQTTAAGSKRKARSTATAPKKSKPSAPGGPQVPRNICRAYWFGSPCNRAACTYDHFLPGHHPPAPQQYFQQHLQQHQTPPTPQQPPQQQQQQQQTAAAGAPRQPTSGANFSRIA